MARRAVSWTVLVAGAVFVVASVVNGFTSDPQQGEGWGGGLIEAVFAGGPLLLVGFGLRSHRPAVVRRAAVASLVLALVVGFVLLMQVLDANETASAKLVNAVALGLYLAAWSTGVRAEHESVHG